VSNMSSIDMVAIKNIARAICKSKTCEGINCCQWPCNGGKRRDRFGQGAPCNVDAGGYDDAAWAAFHAVREIYDSD